jgi:hypothetical protein
MQAACSAQWWKRQLVRLVSAKYVIRFRNHLCPIIFSAYILFTAGLVAWQKNDNRAAADAANPAWSASDASTVMEARGKIQKILSSAEFADLDWNNAKVQKSNDQETMVLVTSGSGPKKDLIYLTGANLKWYKWDNEVRKVPQ